ncbi:hypothetical protein FPANT_2396 [Fusarium pseudoanthophilum]|uniref:NACHT domain-containing protein n=1 Tax=Fusarium pseudoanthophilum TaxID=48495 RepID=A0A8H5UWX3_9HYPO|nr:hypothetical protein FPANT_2396 [Fusarium pseudoanthophilum]
MSGAEAAIAGIGFLCNAMQIVTFGRDILQVYKHVRDEHSPDPRLKSYLESAKACFDDMNSSASQVLPSTRDQQQIIDIGKKLEESMTRLQSKFSELHLDDASRRRFRGKLQVVKKSLASLWQGKELDGLETNLRRYESLLHGVVLHRICNQSQAAEIASQQSFHQLNTNLQSVIKQLSVGRTWMSDLSIESRETRNFVTQEHETTRAAINTGFTTTNGALSSFRDSVSREFQDMAQRDQSKAFEQEHNQLLQSLRFPEMNSRRNHISQNCPGTFDWVFKGPEDRYPGNVFGPAFTVGLSGLNSFPVWLKSDARQYWISGKPASGKSSLMKFLATHPLTLQHLQAQHSNIRILTHYFWKPGQPLQKNIEGMTRSLLYQVLHKNRGLAQRLWTEQPNVQDKRDGGDWDVNELKKALCWAIKFSGNSFCLFLDGLDEAKEFEDLPWSEHQNTQVIYDLLSLDNIKLCASSREEGHFCQFFADKPRLRTHQLNKDDIYQYAQNRLEVSGLSYFDQLRLLSTVVRKANGVFLWVVLAVKSLNRAIRSGGVNEFEERLAQTPSDIHDLLVDMWNRPGDDANLSSYKLDASRFFKLALMATNIENKIYIENWHPRIPPLNSMRSLLVMATAVQNEPLTEIWRAGRETLPDSLQARCIRTEARLQLVSRGLLELTTYGNPDGFPWAGNQALRDYSLKRIEFIHRCAFDFITDTQFGRECLAFCDWSSIEQAERLLAGHLVKSRFLCHETIRYEFNKDGEKTKMDCFDNTHQLATALKVALNWSKSDMYFRDSMIEKLKDWQQCGLFHEHSFWRYPILPEIPSDPDKLLLEFLEIVVQTADSYPLVTKLVDELSIVNLAEAVPVLLCGLFDQLEDKNMNSCLKFIDHILTRLRSATDDVSSNGQHDRVEIATRLLHSWFVMQCLERVPDDWSGDSVTGLLRRFSKTLLSANDWECQLIMEFGFLGQKFVPLSSDGCHVDFVQYTLAISNFVTAYRLLGQLLPGALQVQPPQGAEERFEVLLIRSIGDPLITGGQYFSPGEAYYMDIADYVKKNMLDDDVKVTRKNWSALFEKIDEGLAQIGKDTIGYCLTEINNRNLELVHPWVNGVINMHN